MINEENDDLKKKLESLLNELSSIGPVMRGSVTIMGKKNKQPYFSVNVKGKTKLIYLGEKRAEIANQYIDNYKKILEIIDEMTMVNMQILKKIKTK